MLSFNKKIRSWLASGALASVASMSMVSAANAADYNWRFSNLYGRGTALGEIYENLASNIENLSGEKIKVQVLYSGEGVSTQGLLGAVKSGLVTMGAPFQSMHAGELPAGIVEIGLPGGTSDTDELYDLFHKKGWAPILESAYGAQGMVWLDPYMAPPVYIISKEPINSVEDFKGLKIRAPGAYGKFLRNLGAAPVSLAWSEIYTSLATGVIDASIGSTLIDHRDGNHVEVAKYMYRLPVAGAQVLPIVVNKREWEKLTPELQAAVKKATEMHAKEQLDKGKIWEKEALAEMESKGLKWSPEPSEADKQAWSTAAESLYDEYAQQDKYSKQLVEILKNK